MDELKKMEQAKAAFATLCQTLDKDGWKYKKNEEKLSVECGARGDDLPMELVVNVDAGKQLVLVISHIPFVIQEDKRIDAAVAVSAVNNMLVDGCFDYEVTSGHMVFRLTNSFMESKLSEEVFSYMIYCSCKTIDEFNDKFLMLSKGMITLEQFLSSIK